MSSEYLRALRVDPTVGSAYPTDMAKLPPSVREMFVKYGRAGGKKGGKARARRLTPEQRREAARTAVQARWARAKSRGNKQE